MIVLSLFRRSKNCAQPGLIEDQAESVFRRKLCDFYLPIFCIQRPEALQFILVNSAVLPLASLQLAFDLSRNVSRQRFHTVRDGSLSKIAQNPSL